MTLYSVKGAETRPTSDFVKENLFNIIRDDVRDAVFLDLFAGTGAIGIEALSRGASQVFFADISQKSIDVIRRNLNKARLSEQGRAVVMKDDAVRTIKKLAEQGQKRRFDIIYADPPYFDGLATRVLDGIAEHGILADDGCVVIEMSKTHVLPKARGLQMLRIKEYSSTRLVFFGTSADKAAEEHTALEEINGSSISREL